MKKLIVLSILILIGSAVAAQIPYEEYYRAIEEIETLEQQVEEYTANEEFGRAYEAMEEAREKRMALDASNLGPIRNIIEAEEYANAGCQNSEVINMLNEAYELYETSPRDAGRKALKAKEAAIKAGCQPQVAPPAPVEPEDQSMLIVLVALFVIIIALVVVLKVKERLPP